jgi:3-dehydroquinate synthase
MNNMKKVALDLGDRFYAIHIGKGALAQFAEIVPLDLAQRDIFIVYDENVYPFAQSLEEALAGKCARTRMLAMKGGEATKSFEGYRKVIEWLLEKNIHRQSLLVALGGGVIGDLGGFAASTVMRGVPYVQVPTTLLAQIDSSVGGKTGINTPQGKNLCGTFYQPKAVLCDTATLSTLPERELKDGYAEMVKYGLINRPEFFEWLEEHGDDVLALKEDPLKHAIDTSCKAKAEIVAADETEKGARALLNLGHTFGHALEAACGYDGRLLHGEAVAIGMIMAFQLSVRMGLCSTDDLDSVRAHFENRGLKTRASQISPLPKQSAEEIVALMSRDKKAKGDKIGFILTRGIGKAFQTYDVDMKDVTHIVQRSLEA